jgi:hypothetical protein
LDVRMSHSPKNPKDLALAPVAVGIDRVPVAA